MTIPFTKMHGAGNDFIVIEDVISFTSDEIIGLCHRHYGIGADGIILINDHECSVLFYNSDGTSADMCGNGLRCAAYYRYLKHGCVEQSLKTVSGIYDVTVNGTSVDMKMNPYEQITYNKKIDILGVEYTYTYVRVGNEHIVFYSKYLYEHSHEAGPYIAESGIFKNGINSNFVYMCDNDLYVKTWERGAGATLACGTGSYASALTYFKDNDHRTDITIHVPGGTLYFFKKNDGIYMRGPAVVVFKGEMNHIDAEN